MKTVLAAVAILAVTAAHAESATECAKRLGHEVDCFIKEARFYRFKCYMNADIFAMSGNEADLQRHVSCLKDAEESLARYFAAAGARIERSPGGMSALKDAYSYWNSTMRSLMPTADETRGAYTRRMNDREMSLNDRLERLKLEK